MVNMFQLKHMCKRKISCSFCNVCSSLLAGSQPVFCVQLLPEEGEASPSSHASKAISIDHWTHHVFQGWACWRGVLRSRGHRQWRFDWGTGGRHPLRRFDGIQRSSRSFFFKKNVFFWGFVCLVEVNCSFQMRPWTMWRSTSGHYTSMRTTCPSRCTRTWEDLTPQCNWGRSYLQGNGDSGADFGLFHTTCPSAGWKLRTCPSSSHGMTGQQATQHGELLGWACCGSES